MLKPSTISERIGDEAIKARTGKTWSQWITVLDRAKSQDKSHKEIAAWLHRERGLSAWWSQTITVGYEQAKGRRVLHQKSTGFEISVTKTVNLSAERAFALWGDPRTRRSFLAEQLALRTKTQPKSLRFNREDGSIIEVRLAKKSETKCQVAIQHFKLKSASSASAMKSYWRECLGLFAESAEK